MASGNPMTSPMCLVENTNNQLTVNPKALEILDKISQPVVVVAIAGLYRTGKSYLMNRLAGQNQGFSLGSTVKSQTKGIWMWCVPHPSKPTHTLVLLDTEGLGDVEKGDPKNDSWIFALAVLLSSMFVYNSMSTINHQALEQLHYVTELTQLIRTKASPGSCEEDDSVRFAGVFPDFVWVVRDFTLELEMDKQTITADEYLQNALKLLPGKDAQAQKSNLPREHIKKFFPKQKCFVFDRPTHDKKLLNSMEKVSENQLDINFQKQSKDFCEYIFTHAKTKTINQEVTVTGSGLRTLAKSYVDAINSGTVPCLENAMTALVEHENSLAVEKAANHYSEQMAHQVTFPTDTLQELLEVHRACEKEAIALFIKHSFKDDEQLFHKKLVGTIEKKKKYFLKQNEKESVKRCEAQLKEISRSLMTNISEGTFSVPGGYILYSQEMNKVQLNYNLVSRKGVKANEVFQSFLQAQAATMKSILKADEALSAREKALAEERLKAELAEATKKMAEETEKKNKQMLEERERSYQEHMKQVTEKMKKENEQKMADQERVLTTKLEAALKEIKGLQAENMALKKDVGDLKEKGESKCNIQ